MKTRTKIVAVAVAVLAVAGGGAAVAATEPWSPKAESDAIVNDVAGQLGVQPSALTDALKKALANRVDAAVADGRLTQEQAAALKERIEAGEFPLFGVPHVRGHGVHLGFGLDAAASYLGLTEAELRTELEAGSTLAEVAKEKGKSVDGLVQALKDDAEAKLDDAVEAGRLTEAQKDALLQDLEQRITELVNGELGPGFRGPGYGFRGVAPSALPSADA